VSQPKNAHRRIMTVLEARVPADQWDKLREIYQASLGELPSQMVRTMLVQSTTEPDLWRGISIWHSREALAEYRRKVQTPEGIVMFRAVGAEPTLALFEVAVEAEAD
jgi:hypothetical protein